MKIMLVYGYFILLVLMTSCRTVNYLEQGNRPNILLKILEDNKADFQTILENPMAHEVQIIYTLIDRDKNNVPHLTPYYFNVDSTFYFYPASTVKMPLAFMALEKINHLKKKYPSLQKETPYKFDSLRIAQIPLSIDTSAANGLPSIAHDIKQIFLVSDNYAYNNLFDFLGRQYINETLRNKGYNHTQIMHRFSIPNIDNRYTRPITFYNNINDKIIYQQGELLDNTNYQCTQNNYIKGNAYYDVNDSLINEPFNMSKKNYTSLNDLDAILKSVIFPELFPPSKRFDLTKEDYAFLYRYMSMLPKESHNPDYPMPEYYDSYCKFLMYGDSKDDISKNIRIFNKVGDAYGYLTDVAYIVDFEKGIEFFLAATIATNDDGVFNDDKYNYEQLGFPFLGKLGRAVYDYECKRTRKINPDLKKFAINY